VDGGGDGSHHLWANYFSALSLPGDLLPEICLPLLPLRGAADHLQGIADSMSLLQQMGSLQQKTLLGMAFFGLS
jgi:hypothetical protein